MLPLTSISSGSRYNLFIDGSGQIFKKSLSGYNGFLEKLNTFGSYPDNRITNILIRNNGYFFIRGIVKQVTSSKR